MNKLLRKLKSFITLSAVAGLCVVPLFSGGVGFAQDFADEVVGGASQVDGGGDSSGRINNVIRSTLTLLSWVAGVISIFMLMISGIRITLANGDSSTISSARNGIIYALVGLVIVVMAQVIVRFVLNNVA